MVQTIQIELSIDCNTTGSQIQINAYVMWHLWVCSMIQRLNSYNLLTEKVAEQVP